jgi:predicted DCC family thiol-disulfide oxidoreductase YuxK
VSNALATQTACDFPTVLAHAQFLPDIHSCPKAQPVRHLNTTVMSLRGQNLASHILVYDSDCGPCTKFKNVVSFLDPRRTLSFASLVEADRLGLLNGLPQNVRYKSFHIITPVQSPRSGAEALPRLFGLIMGGTHVERAVRSIPFGFQVISSVYRVLSRVHDSGTCFPPGLGAMGSESASGSGLRPKQN